MHRVASSLLRQGAAAGVAAAHRRLAPPLRPHAAPAPGHRSHTLAPPITAIATPYRQAFRGLNKEAAEPAAPASAPVAPSISVLPKGLGALWQGYLRSLQRRPLLTKAATSFVCVVIGDSLAQMVGGAPYSAVRVLRLATYSSAVGATVGHSWHRFLDASVHPEAPGSTKAVAKKTLLDQLVLSPAMLLVFFAAVKLMEGQPHAILPYVQDKYVPTLLAGYALWVPFNIVSFKYIPQDLRILAGNLVGLGWGCYMSITCINTAPMPNIACPATAAAVAAAVAQAAAQE